MIPDRDRVGAVLGLVGVAGNVVGVAALGGVAGAYRPGQLAAWAEGALAHPAASVASAVAFTVGLLALAGWAQALRRRLPGPLAPLAGAAMAAGALVNAAGTLAPAVLVLHVAPACGEGGCAPVARALLGATLSLDALFNLAFGAGLALAGLGLWRAGRRALGGLGLAAGLAAVPVSAQIALEPAADLLALAGPLWLAFVVATSVALWRGQGAAVAVTVTVTHDELRGHARAR
jgi:hypothetical protein